MAAAKVYFILLGLVQQVALKFVLGLANYGALSSALSMASVSYNPLISTSIQGVSRAVASSPEQEQPAALRRTFFIHAALGLLLAAGFFAVAPAVATAIGAPHIANALRILSLVLVLYGMYTPLVGALNGKKRFLHQAGLDASAATLRTGGLIGGAFLLSRASAAQASGGLGGVEGAALGFAVAATGILALAGFMVGIGRRGAGGPSVREHLLFIFPLLLGQVLLNLLFQADLFLLRWFAASSAKTAGLDVLAADPLVGAYRATQLFSFLPYQLLLAITFILFPMLASAHRDGQTETVARYVRAGVRLALVTMGLMVSVTSGLSGPLLNLVFGADTAALGTRSMQLLTLGFGAFAILGILTTVLNSLKHERQSAIVTAIAFALVVGLCWLRVRGSDFGPGLLFRTATATSIGLVLATLSAAWLVKRAAGAVVEPLSVLRVVVAMAVAIVVGRQLPETGKLLVPVLAIVVGVVYGLSLLLMRELKASDLANVRAVLARRR